jgi:hypothetical protein
MFDQRFFHFFEQLSRLKGLGEDLKSFKELPIFETIIVEKSAHQENRNTRTIGRIGRASARRSE